MQWKGGKSTADKLNSLHDSLIRRNSINSKCGSRKAIKLAILNKEIHLTPEILSF